MPALHLSLGLAKLHREVSVGLLGIRRQLLLPLDSSPEAINLALGVGAILLGYVTLGAEHQLRLA